ncbi:hypothetical protein SUDANB51_00473 [Streptomyces sp. enrichment culture]
MVFRPGFLPPATLAAGGMDPPYRQAPVLPLGQDARALGLGLEHLAFGYAALTSLPLAAHVEVLRHLVSVLVLRLAKVTGGSAAPAPATEVFRRLSDAVERDHRVTRRVEDCAAALGYSPRTLSRASLAVTGMSAKKYIDERVLLEAKRLLLHTDRAAKDVAAELGYSPIPATSPSSSGCGRARRPERSGREHPAPAAPERPYAGGRSVVRRATSVGESLTWTERLPRSAMRSRSSRAAFRPISWPAWSTLVREI